MVIVSQSLVFASTETLPCASNPCQNGATCFDHNGGSGYVCLCPTGFEGTNCGTGTHGFILFMIIFQASTSSYITLIHIVNFRIKYNETSVHLKLIVRYLFF